MIDGGIEIDGGRNLFAATVPRVGDSRDGCAPSEGMVSAKGARTFADQAVVDWLLSLEKAANPNHPTGMSPGQAVAMSFSG